MSNLIICVTGSSYRLRQGTGQNSQKTRIPGFHPNLIRNTVTHLSLSQRLYDQGLYDLSVFYPNKTATSADLSWLFRHVFLSISPNSLLPIFLYLFVDWNSCNNFYTLVHCNDILKKWASYGSNCINKKL